MTDEEVICTWMEPKPSVPDDVGKCSVGFWWWMGKKGWEPWGHLTLDPLWEVEERLKQWCLEEVTRSQFWDEYPEALLETTSRPQAHEDPLWHADAQVRIKALAIVLRPLVETKGEK